MILLLTDPPRLSPQVILSASSDRGGGVSVWLRPWDVVVVLDVLMGVLRLLKVMVLVHHGAAPFPLRLRFFRRSDTLRPLPLPSFGGVDSGPSAGVLISESQNSIRKKDK